MQKENKGSIDLTRGSIPGGILAFAIPLFLGQLLQQLYNMVDAWVIGNFADNDAFAAVSSTGTVVFLIIGFFSGIATGGGVVTQPRTMKVLSENSFVVYIKRDIEKIIMSANHQSRPLFTSNEAVRQLFAARQSLYEEYANFVLENNESPQAALKGLSAILRARGL